MTRGFTLQETLLVMFLGVVASAAAMPLVRQSMEQAEDAQLVEMLATLVTAIREEHAQATTYSGLSTATVLPRLPGSWAFGSDAIRHPLNGTIQLAASSADPAQFELTVNVQRDDTCVRVIRSSWPLFDSIRVNQTALKDRAGLPLPSPESLSASCVATRIIRLRSE